MDRDAEDGGPRADPRPRTALGLVVTARGGSGPVGEPEPPGIRATDTEGGFFWIYAPVRFDDHAMVTIMQERPSGERIMQDAHRVFPWARGTKLNGWADPSTSCASLPGPDR